MNRIIGRSGAPDQPTGGGATAGARTAVLPSDPPAWVARWIGLPFRLGGRGPAAYDCWGLARAVLKAEFGICLPRYDRGYPKAERDRAALAALVRYGMSGWRCIVNGNDPDASDDEWLGDLVLLRHGQHACHIGIVVARGAMLHTEEGTDSVLDRFDGQRWLRRLVGIYRLEGAKRC